MSIVSKTTCPECQFSEALVLFGKKSRSFCPRCGCEFQWIFDSKRQNSHVIKNIAYGACRMQFSKGHARVGAVVEPITSEVIDDFQGMINEEEIMEAGSYLTRWDPVNKFGEIIIGSTSFISFL